MQLIGAHVSAAGGVSNAPLNAHKEGCETFQFFVGSPQTFKVKYPDDAEIEKFHVNMKEHGFTESWVHASYLINLASQKNSTRYGSISLLRKGLEACDALGVQGMMFHTGSARDWDKREDAVKQAIESINKVLDGYTGSTKLLVENAAGAGGTMGATFEEVGALVKGAENQSKIGFCLDTQHAFGSGYDWRTKKGTDDAMKEITKYIGLRKLAVVQYNDSKVELASNKDRHEHIAEGHMGEEAAKNILGHDKLKNKSFCLETPFEGREADIEYLKSIRKK